MSEIDLRRFDLNLLLVFEALLAERHVGRAAARLGLTQSGASYALARLRDVTGDALFVRHPKGVQPTARALALAGPIADVLERARTALSPPEPFDPQYAKRSFTLGATDYVTLVVLPPLLARLRSQAPGIDIKVRNIDRDTIAPLLDRGEIDVAIGIVPVPLPKRFEATRLFEERLACIARKGHPAFVDRGRLSPADFAALPQLLVTPRGDLAGPIDVSLARYGLERRIAVAVPHVLSAPFAVGASDLVAVMAERIIGLFAGAAGVTVHPIPVEVEGWSIGLIRRREINGDPGMIWFCGQIIDVAAVL